MRQRMAFYKDPLWSCNPYLRKLVCIPCRCPEYFAHPCLPWWVPLYDTLASNGYPIWILNMVIGLSLFIFVRASILSNGLFEKEFDMRIKRPEFIICPFFQSSVQLGVKPQQNLLFLHFESITLAWRKYWQKFQLPLLSIESCKTRMFWGRVLLLPILSLLHVRLD